MSAFLFSMSILHIRPVRSQEALTLLHYKCNTKCSAVICD